MGPLEAMAAAYTARKHGKDVWPILSEDCRQDIIESMRTALCGLDACDIPYAAKHAGRPYRGGEDVAEATFRAVLRQIVEEGR